MLSLKFVEYLSHRNNWVCPVFRNFQVLGFKNKRETTRRKVEVIDSTYFYTAYYPPLQMQYFICAGIKYLLMFKKLGSHLTMAYYSSLLNLEVFPDWKMVKGIENKCTVFSLLLVLNFMCFLKLDLIILPNSAVWSLLRGWSKIVLEFSEVFKFYLYKLYLFCLSN